MRVVVVGADQVIGRAVLQELRHAGHQVVPADPGTAVDPVTGEGMVDACRGASVVVDVAYAPSFDGPAASARFRATTGNVVAAVRRCGVPHHVVLSIVGAEQRGNTGYFAARREQEALVARSGVAATIVRATEVFELVPAIVDTMAVDDAVPVAPVWVQPIAAEDLARSVAHLAGGAPVASAVEVGGPEVLRLDELVRRVLAAGGGHRRVVVDPNAPFLGSEVGPTSLLPSAYAVRTTTGFDDWRATRSHTRGAARLSLAQP